MTDASSPLRNYWYAVRRSADVGDTPAAVQLLGERLVLWRSGGQITALKDLCIHRGSPLSIGWVEDGGIVCAYHGWRYDKLGACTRIPALPADRTIPPKARVTAYHCQERYGLVFVCLGEPRMPIPDFPQLEDPGYHSFLCDATPAWRASAARVVENFCDIAHLAWVHNGLLGERERPEAPDITVQTLDHEIRFTVAAVATQGTPGSSGQADVADHQLTYRMLLPFTVAQERVISNGRRRYLFQFTTPIAEHESDRFLFVSRNFDLDAPDQPFLEFTRIVGAQDKNIVERQRPEELPVDLSEELHLRGPDGPAVAYRRMLRELGLAEPGIIASAGRESGRRRRSPEAQTHRKRGRADAR